MRTKPRALLALGAGLLALWLLAGCSAEPSTPPDTPSGVSKKLDILDLQDFCNEAGRLASRDPKAAIELIDSVRAAAKEASERDETLTEDQLALMNACDEVRVSAEARVATNAVEAANDKRAEEAEAEANKTPAETFGEGWTDVVEHWFSPLGGVGILAAALIVGQLIVTRLLSLAPVIRSGLNASGRGVLGAVGFALMAISSVALAALFVSIGKASTVDGTIGWLLVEFGVVAVLGIVLFALWLSSRLRLTVDVFTSGEKADKDELATSRVVNLLSSLAGTPPDGINVPLGTDVKELTGATLPSTAANKVLEVVQAVIVYIFFGTPWRVVIARTARAWEPSL